MDGPQPIIFTPTLMRTRPLFDEAATLALFGKLSEQLDSAVPPEARLILVGIRRRGDIIAAELGRRLRDKRPSISVGSLDITLYRDDFAQVGAFPEVGTSRIPGTIEGAHVVIVDDVIYTGRTIRAALNELADFGRALKTELCVLVDRGGRELPIQPDYAGHALDTGPHMEVAVRVPPTDGYWSIELVELDAPGHSE